MNIIVAYDRQRGMGARGDLPWGRDLPGDLANFKRLTKNTSVIMGRKTFVSIGRPLPERENIVISRSAGLTIEGVLCVTSLASAIASARHKAFVIGGAQIYREALPWTDTVFATEVHETFSDVDTYFPVLAADEWVETDRQSQAGSSCDQFAYDFVRYDRIVGLSEIA